VSAPFGTVLDNSVLTLKGEAAVRLLGVAVNDLPSNSRRLASRQIAPTTSAAS
jgi:hypothetical protein